MPIHEWPERMRPREKLLTQGAASLTDAELLAIFLRTGVTGFSAVDLAEKLIGDYGSISNLLAASHARFVEGKGLGSAKYVQLQAVMELAARHLTEDLKRGRALTDAQTVKRYLGIQIRNPSRELFHVLFLDTQHKLIAGETLFSGTLGTTAVYPREILRRVLELNAAAVILAHNHPSGVSEPSAADIRITDEIRRSLELIDVRLLDHMIVGDRDVLSFAEQGLL
ncbi:MAG: DNA repair protein RadC [Pseudomonadales bacterium]